MKGALDIHRELLSREIPHEILRLPRVVLSADEIPDVLGIDPEQTIRVGLYRSDDQMIAVATPSGSSLQMEALLRATGTRTLRPATAQEINESTDYAARLVAPLLLPQDVPLYVDARLGRMDVVYTPTGDTGTALGIGTADLLVTSGARVADLTSPSLAEFVLDLEV